MAADDINVVTLTGNLTRDPELRVTENGLAILRFAIAVNDSRRNPETQEWESYANFFNCTLFGKRAESLSSILKKGMKVAVNGKLHYSSSEGDDGNRRTYISVNVNDIVLPAQQRSLDDRCKEVTEAAADGKAGTGAKAAYAEQDIPF